MTWFELANAASAWALSAGLNGLWIGLLLAVFAAILLRAVPRSNAASRYAVWFTAMLLIVAIPALLPFMPKPVLAAAPAAVAARPALEIPATSEWPLYAALAWLAVTAVLLARVGWSILHIMRLKRRAELLGSRGNIRLLASSEVKVPVAAGFIRRAVVFPEWLLAELTPAEFEQVLGHEMAHLRRGDDWTQLFYAVAQAILFFNPALGWIGRRLKIEREMACDDWVVCATGQPRPYAACLTHVHELTRRASAPQLAPGATTKRRWQITARVEALLRPDRIATPHFSRSGWLAAGALVSAALLMAVQAPELVGIQPVLIAPVRFARLNPPSAPILTAKTAVPVKVVPARPRLLASRVRRPARVETAEKQAETGYFLVGAWSVEAPRAFLIITVVFFEPPPPTALNRI